MYYEWESLGDQDECTRKVCMLGPYLLEHVEDHWVTTGIDKHGEKIEAMMMVSRIWLWDDNDKAYDIVTELDPVEYQREQSYKNAEDWYAVNVLSEELFIGDADERKETSQPVRNT